MDAISAHQGAFNLTVEVAFHALQVWPPCALGFVVRVTDTISDRAAFAAQGANSSHLSSLSSRLFLLLKNLFITEGIVLCKGA